ncbi:hypothetical protein Tco_1192425 [Tanacetum coccineum]
MVSIRRSLELDDRRLEDAFGLPRAMVTSYGRSAYMTLLRRLYREGNFLLLVNDEESTSGNTIQDESVGFGKNEPVDSDKGNSLNLAVAVNDDGDNETKGVNLAENIEERNVSDDISSDQVSGLEGKEVVNDGNNEAKVLNVSDVIEENNAFDATSGDQLTELEANEVVNDGDGEVEVLNLVRQAIDAESTSDNEARDQSGELETKVLVDGKQDGAEVVGVVDEQNSDKPDVLENNGVVGVGVNENNEGSKGILEDVPEVNKKAADVNYEIYSENWSFSDAALDEQVIHIRTKWRIRGSQNTARWQIRLRSSAALALSVRVPWLSIGGSVKNHLSFRAPSWSLGKRVVEQLQPLISIIDEFKFGTMLFNWEPRRFWDVVGTVAGY